MNDEQFQKLCNTFGFAPSRALREMLDAATRQAVIAEQDRCCGLIFGWAGSDNVAQRTVDAIRRKA